MKIKGLFLGLCLLCAGYVIYYRFTHAYLTETQLFTRLWYVIIPAVCFAVLSNLGGKDKPGKTETLKDIDYVLSIIVKVLIIIFLIVVILFLDTINNEPVYPKFYR